MSGVSLFMVTIVVPDMDDGIAHYCHDWGFSLTRDSRHSSGHRWVELSPGDGARLRLVEADDEVQHSVIGRQAGGRVAFFLRVEAFDATVAEWAANGIKIVEPTRLESYGRVVVLRDKFANRWDVFDARDESRT